MGIGPFHMSSCRCYTEPVKVVEKIVEKIVMKYPNPNPDNFEIMGIEEFGKNLVVLIQYPDCTNYEGKKLMIYRNITKQEILDATKLDPHFCDHCKLSPFARFEPTKFGLAAARKLAKQLNKEKI
jgi:hypothetical protein